MATVFRAKAFRVEEIFPVIKGKRAKYDVIRKSGASVIVPILPDKRILLERQKRYVINRFIYELPAGTMEKGENPRKTAARELEEETGYKARSMKLLFKGYSSPGIMDEMLYFYVAEGLYKGKMRRERDEIMTLKKISLEEAIKMMRNGTIIDAKTIAGILYYANLCSQNTSLL